MQTNQPKEEKKVPKRPPLLLVEWYDAHHEFGWMEGNEDLEPVEIPLVYSVGWLLTQNEQGMRICQSWTDDNHAQTLTIPGRMIERVLQLDPENVTLAVGMKSMGRRTMRKTKPTI